MLTPIPGVSFIPPIIEAIWEWPSRRSIAIAWALVVPGFRRAPMRPSKSTLVALPRISGPDTMKATDVTPRPIAIASLVRSGRSRSSRRCRVARRSLLFWGGTPPPRIAPMGPMLISRRPRRAGRRRSRGTARNSRELVVRAIPTTRPSSSTMMRSACMMVLTRWATMTTEASWVPDFKAARRRASVAASRAEKQSSKR